MTAAEQLAEAIQRVLDEAVEKMAAKLEAAKRPDASLSCKEAAKILSYHPTFVLRLARSGILKSDGEGRGRRYRVEYVEDFRRRLKAAGGRIWDLDVMMGRDR
jgi:helix-turn-helix protein